MYIDVYVDQNCMFDSESSTFSCGWYVRTVRAVLFGCMRKRPSKGKLAMAGLPSNWPWLVCHKICHGWSAINLAMTGLP